MVWVVRNHLRLTCVACGEKGITNKSVGKLPKNGCGVNTSCQSCLGLALSSSTSGCPDICRMTFCIMNVLEACLGHAGVNHTPHATGPGRVEETSFFNPIK